MKIHATFADLIRLMSIVLGAFLTFHSISSFRRSIAAPRLLTTMVQSPAYQGYHDGAGCNTIQGWAWDANNPSGTVNVDIYDGNTVIGTTTANMYREDLLNALGSAYHGFSFYTPAALKNGAVHTIYVKFSGTSTLLSNTGRSIQCSGTPAFQGFHDGIGCNSIVGWARDINDPTGTVNVDIYNGATLIGTAQATQYRQDLADVFGDPYHGFAFPMPASLKDGQPHSITVKFGGTDILLSNTPKTFTCTSLTPNFQGQLDLADCNTISGYALDLNDDSSTINVAIYRDGGFIVVIPAQQAYQGIGSGYHGYKFAVPAWLKDGQPHSITVKFSGTATNLSGTPQTITCLLPSGDATGHTDWTNINNALNGSSHTVTLGVGTFYIYQPILFPQVSGAKLLGSGNTASGSVIEPVYASSECSPNPSCFVGDSGNLQFPLRYQPIILTKNAPNGQISNFMLSLDQLRKSYNHLGNFAIQVGTGSRPSPGTQVTSVRIVGSQATTGWANGGGIVIVSSTNCAVSNNVLTDFGYTTEFGSTSVGGHHAINVQNSRSALVQNNVITRVSICIEVLNNANQPGDSSYTNVSGNDITGPTSLTCSDCSGGRSIELWADGDAPPLQHLVVQNNTARGWGGQNQGATTPVGLVLVTGVQYSTFSGNNFDGSTDSRASYGLQIRSSFMGPASACHHNTFTGNKFRAGNCFSQGCRDVFFNDDGPDQGFASLPGISDIGRHANGGNNDFTTVDWATDSGCSQFAHAFFVYPSGQSYVNRGQSITLAAAGIHPDSSPITFFFYDPNGSLVTTAQYAGGNGSCVMNQQSFTIDPALFINPGLYKILATYNDGNSTAQIVKDWIGTGGQQVLLDVR